jgi:hypothetical protein
MSEEFNCDICNAPMKKTRTVGTKESGKRYRQRWFKCQICDFEKKINGSGYYQETIAPELSIQAATRRNRQINREI